MNKPPKNLPSTIGVYIFKSSKGEILYIGKSVNIKARVKSHFENAKLDAKERLIVENAHKIETIATESEFKALILESSLIQKFRPKYNKIWMDDKSYLYVCISIHEEYPKISLLRKSDFEALKFQIPNSKFQINPKLQISKQKNKNLYFGPFSSRRTLENLLREIRRVIPFCMSRRLTKTPCFYSKIGLCEPCPNYISELTNSKIKNLKQEYKKNIKEIIKIFNGKVEIVLKDLRRELAELSKKEKYEEALLMRNRIERFEKLISEREFEDNNFFSTTDYKLPTTDLSRLLAPYFQNMDNLHRIECYDVSNLNFREATAAMTVAIDGQVDKGQYRKFKIQNIDCRGAVPAPKGGGTPPLQNVDWDFMQSVFLRRFKHDEWQFPNLLVVDGGKPQVRMAVECMRELKLQIPVIGIAKNPDRLVIGIENMPTIRPELNNAGFNLIRLLRDEAHRFGRKYHLFLREKKLI